MRTFPILDDNGSVRIILGKIFSLLLLLFSITAGVAQEVAPLASTAKSPELLMSQGIKLFQQKEYNQALEDFEAVLAIDASSAEAYFYAGTIYVILKKGQKGVDYLERSVALAPDNARLRFILAQTYENLSFLDKAIETYEKIEQMAPNTQEAKESSRHARILKGRKYGEKSMYDKALQEFAGVLKDFPNDIQALTNQGLTLSLMGRLDEAQAVIEKALTIQPGNAILHKYLADIFEKKRDVSNSKREYEQILRLVTPDSPLAKLADVKLALFRGSELLTEGKFADAGHEFEKVLAVEPNNPIARFNMVAVYHGLGDMAKAQEMLHKLIEVNPDNLDARIRLGALYLELGNLNDAIQEFENIISRGKDTSQAQQAAKLLENIRSKEKGKLSQNMTTEGRIALYKSILSENSDDRQAWLELGLLYGQLRRSNEEKEAFENVVRLTPDDPRALAILAGLYGDSDNLDKAMELYERALPLEENPDQKLNLQRQLSIVKARKAYSDGDMRDAKKQFEAILDEDKNNFIVHFYLALIYSSDGKLEHAIQEYQEVLRIVPGHLGARLNLAIAYEQVGREEDAITEYQAVARSGVSGLSATAKTRLKALMKRVGGFSFNLNYYLNFDSNSNLSAANPVQELLSSASASVIYRRKIKHKRIYWGLRFSPTYSVYHQLQFDFLQMDLSPFVRTTWRDTDYSWNYSYSQTDSVLTNRNYNKSNSFYMDALRRFKMRSLLPFLTSAEQREATPSVWRINGNYRAFQSDTSPAYDSNTYSLGLLINQGSTSGWTWTANYVYTINNNLKPIGNDFAYSSHGINFQLSKSVTPKLNANASYGYIYSSYKHPDSVTRFTEYRVNKFHTLSAGLNYAVNDALRIYSDLVYQRNNSNLPTGFILSAEDASTLIGIQSPSLGDYHKYTISAGLSLDF